MTRAEVKRVIEAIKVAFVVARAGGISLSEAEVIKHRGNQPDREKARTLDTDRCWEEVPDQRIATSPDLLPFLDPIGFRYYLPAYMSWVVKNLGRSDSPSIDWTIYALLPYEDKGAQRRQEEKIKLLSKPQREAVSQFLRFVSDDHLGKFCDVRAARMALRAWASG